MFTSPSFLKGLWVVIGALLLISPASSAQTETDPPVVGFVIDRGLMRLSVPSNTGAFGVTRLAEIFRDYGAQTINIELAESVPENVDVIVLVGPEVTLSPVATGYLWEALARGTHLFMALDPNSYYRVRTENARSGITQLLEREYGLETQDNFVAAPWFSQLSADRMVNAWIRADAEDILTHPVVAPLRQYQLPVWMWGARSVDVAGFGLNSDSFALLYSSNAYGERAASTIGNNARNPLELNVGEDDQGYLLLGGIGTNLETGSRVVVLGDGQIAQNIFGLTRRSVGTDLPRYPGNDLLNRRLAGWLLGLPEADWATLDEGFTQIALDGQVDDWSSDMPVYTDVALDVSPLGHDIREVQVLRNDQFMYLSLVTGAPLSEDLQIGIRLNGVFDDQTIVIQGGEASTTNEQGLTISLPDAAYVYGEQIELRIPLRATGVSPVLTQICLSTVFVISSDCIDATMPATVVDTVDPVPVRFPEMTMALVRTNNFVNLRDGPDTSAEIITQLGNRAEFAAIGRNELGDWVQVANGRYDGWIASFLVSLNGDIQDLPVRPQ